MQHKGRIESSSQITSHGYPRRPAPILRHQTLVSPATLARSTRVIPLSLQTMSRGTRHDWLRDRGLGDVSVITKVSNGRIGVRLSRRDRYRHLILVQPVTPYRLPRFETDLPSRAASTASIGILHCHKRDHYPSPESRHCRNCLMSVRTQARNYIL